MPNSSAIVPDASAIVEVVLGSEEGERVMGRVGETEMLAPELLDAEVAHVLRKAWLRGETTADLAVGHLATLASTAIRRIANRSLLSLSTRWWSNVTAYDALYLAAAALNGAIVITLDGPLARAPIADVVIENL